jgi:hypothetical protein
VPELGQKGPFGQMRFGGRIRNLKRTMEKDPLALATRLLVKAQGTTFDAEAAALTGKAYRLLAEALNSYDDSAASTGAPRKRERRLLRDRRSTPGPAHASRPRRTTETAPVNLHPTDRNPLPSYGHVDLRI